MFDGGDEAAVAGAGLLTTSHVESVGVGKKVGGVVVVVWWLLRLEMVW